jgi:hypothetical protein
MKKYAVMGFLFFFTIAVSTIAIRSAQATDTQNTGTTRYSTINPTEYIRRITEAAYKKLTVFPTLNPTERAKYLTLAPIRKLTEAARKPTLRPTINPTDYIRKLSGTPERRLIEMPKLVASPSGILIERREEVKKKLTDEKLKVCLEKSQDVKKRSVYLVNSVREIQKKFTSIVEGVENYYKEKIAPSGITLPNYDVHVADISSREKIVTSLLEKAQTDATNFSCTGVDPHGQLQQLDIDVRAVLQALQEYRTGIYNLITALRGLKIVEPTANTVRSVTPINAQ